MPKTVEIRMTAGGFEVTIGGHTDRFPQVDDALAFAHERLSRAHQLRELSTRIE